MNKYFLYCNSVISIMFSIFIFKSDTAKFDTYTKNMKCYEVNTIYIQNYTCRIFSKRGTQGLIFAYFDVIKLEHITVNFQIFQKSSVTYQPWAVNFTVDLCEAFKNLNHFAWNNPAIKMVLLAGNKMFPRAMEGCPYEGKYESTKIDLNATLYPLLPPVFPTGQFKLSFHAFHTKLRDTILKAHLEVIHKQYMEYRAMNFNFK